MKLLLDTHIWVWSVGQPHRLSRRVAKVLNDSRNELWISPVSLWEVLLLSRKKRLDVGRDCSAWISAALEKVPLREAPLTHEVAFATESVMLPHYDPADLFLAATAKVYGLTLVTADRNLQAGSAYSVFKY